MLDFIFSKLDSPVHVDLDTRTLKKIYTEVFKMCQSDDIDSA